MRKEETLPWRLSEMCLGKRGGDRKRVRVRVRGGEIAQGKRDVVRGYKDEWSIGPRMRVGRSWNCPVVIGEEDDDASKNSKVNIVDDDHASKGDSSTIINDNQMVHQGAHQTGSSVRDHVVSTSPTSSSPSTRQLQLGTQIRPQNSAHISTGSGPTGKTHAVPKRKAAHGPRMKSTSVHVEKVQKTSQNVPKSFQHIRKKRKAHKQTHDTCSPKPAATTSRPTPVRLVLPSNILANNQEDFSLNDIPDFNTRKDVAQLMAVAPGLPIRDLHDMLANLHGDFATARAQAIRASRAPSPRPFVKTESPTSRYKPGYDYTHAHMAYDDEVLIKVDANVEFPEWDYEDPGELEISPKMKTSGSKHSRKKNSQSRRWKNSKKEKPHVRKPYSGAKIRRGGKRLHGSA